MFRQENIQESIDDRSLPDNRQKPHILVVDDEQDILRIVALCLEQSGYDVSTANNTLEAYCLLGSFEFDVILTDVMMPDEDGIAFLGKIHQIMPDVPVIIMTGFAQLQMAVNAIKNGAFDFIHKPFDYVYLRQVITKAITYARLRNLEKKYRVELEEAVARRTQELEQALAQLDATRALLLKAANDKTEFITKMTHEMRTPMNGVIGALDLLSDTVAPGPQQEYLCLARQSAGNMVELIDRLLSFSSGAGRCFAVFHDVLDLPDAIRSVTEAHRPRFAANGLTFDAQVAPLTPRYIICDKEQLIRLLDILLSNALKFTSKGGVSLEVSPELAEGRHALIRICVSDSGIGIPADMIEHVFEPFVQGDGALNRRYGGAGLGLSIARQIAALFDGVIGVESTPGEGSRFCCQLRFEVPEP